MAKTISSPQILIPEAYTFDDVLLLPGASDVLPDAVPPAIPITKLPMCASLKSPETKVLDVLENRVIPPQSCDGTGASTMRRHHHASLNA